MIGGSEVALLPHLIEYYRSLGIESFFLIRHTESTADDAFHAVEAYAAASGISIFHSHLSPWEDEINQRLVRYAMDENPDDWYVVVDSDEFQVYDRPVDELVDQCNRQGYDHVTGCLLDRIGPAGTFPGVQDGSIWKQFPLAGSISAALVRALPLKAVLVHGQAQLLYGQHGVPDGRPMPREQAYVQVHHFKWTRTALDQLRRRIRRYEAGTWHPHPAVIRETRRFLRHVDQHGGHIDVADPRLKLHPAGCRFSDYPFWKEVADEAQGWRWTLR